MSYKNYTWEAFAREYNSPYLRNRLWTHSFFRQAKLLGNSRVAVGIASRNNHIEYLVDFSTWTKAYEELKAKVLHDYGYLDDLINRSIECGEKLNNWTENNIFDKDLGGLTNQELIVLLKKFVDMQEDECAYGAALPILDYQDFSFVESNLTKFLKAKLP